MLHGGGNTSVKTTAKDQLGEDVDVLCVKGSGWDMGNIEPQGLPAVRLHELRRLRRLNTLSDEDMVNFQRINLLDSTAPNPSVETLLHAFLPHKFIDHTHSTAVLAMTDQPDGEKPAREIYGTRVAYVPYFIPGFTLAKAVADVFDANPKVEGLILPRHGIFTFAEDAKTAYEKMIEFVTLAEERLQKDRKPLKQAMLPKHIATVAEIAPILRGAVAIERNAMAGTVKRQILCFRANPTILNYVNGAEIARYSQQGVVTPDHTIRTKNWPLIVPAPDAHKLDAWAKEVHAAVDAFVAHYHDYFARNNAASTPKKKELDPLPRVILVPGVGMFGLGATAKDAAIAADIAENTIEVIGDAEAIGEYRCISENDASFCAWEERRPSRPSPADVRIAWAMLKTVAASAPPQRRLARVWVDPERIIRRVVGLRPFRASGFVVRAETLGDRLLVHDYGHGGAGVTLSWGTAELAADLVREAGRTGSGGRAGLRRGRSRGGAHAPGARLRRHDLRASELPPGTTSSVAGASWYPAYIVERARRTPAWDAQFERAQRLSHRAFQGLVGEDYGVCWRESTFSPKTPRRRARRLGTSGDLFPQRRTLSASDNPFAARHVVVDNLMFIEPPTYLRALMRDFSSPAAGSSCAISRRRRELAGCPRRS